VRELAKAILPRGTQLLVRKCIDTVRARSIWLQMRLPGRRPRSNGPTDGMRIGLLVVRFPPETGSGVYRPTSFARYTAEAGNHVTVVAARARQQLNAPGQYLAGHIPARVSVHRAEPQAQFAFPGSLPVLAGGFSDMLDLYTTADRVFRDRPPDVILATGPQFYTHIAAQRLAAKYRCPLVLDYRDEWTECPFDFIDASDLDRKWERRCLAAAQLVLFTTESQRAHALETFAELSHDRCVVVPNGWEPRDSDEQAAADEPERADEVRTISFIGNLGSHRLPHTLLADLEAALADRPDMRERLRLRFVGPKASAAVEALARFPWPEMIESIGHVPKSEAGRLMRESTCLLVQNPADMHRYIPGKLYEYVAAGPPILVHGAGGEIGALVERLGLGWVVPEGDPRALALALAGVLSPDIPRSTGAEREQWLAEHTREANAERLVDLLRSLVGP
jgi:glycosyltransferase involved in cell wall biosynthesis